MPLFVSLSHVFIYSFIYTCISTRETSSIVDVIQYCISSIVPDDEDARMNEILFIIV